MSSLASLYIDIDRNIARERFGASKEGGSRRRRNSDSSDTTSYVGASEAYVLRRVIHVPTVVFDSRLPRRISKDDRLRSFACLSLLRDKHQREAQKSVSPVRGGMRVAFLDAVFEHVPEKEIAIAVSAVHFEHATCVFVVPKDLSSGYRIGSDRPAKAGP